MPTQQVETATVVGTVTGTGNAAVTVTAYGMGSSPKTINVAVTDGDSASTVGGLIRTALAFDSDVAAMFLISGSGANVVLTKHTASANDSTLNVAITNGTCTGLTPALTSTNTTAGDGVSNGYCSIADIRNTYVINITGTNADGLLTYLINGVSRKIDTTTGRRYYATSEARYYTATDIWCVKVDGIGSASGVTIETDLNADGVYEYTWASTDYNLGPYNALANGSLYNEIETAPLGQYIFPTSRRGVKVTASFGYTTVPDFVRDACMMQVNRLWSRFKTPLGQAGASAIGQMNLSIPKLDPDVLDLLEDMRSRV